MNDVLIRKPENPAKQFLSRYKQLARRQEALLAAARAARERTTGFAARLKPIHITGGNGAYDRMAEDVARAVDDEALAMDAVQRQIAAALQDILDAIESVPYENQKTVLTLRYVQALSWQEIAQKLQYSERMVQIFHGRGLLNVRHWMEGHGYA